MNNIDINNFIYIVEFRIEELTVELEFLLVMQVFLPLHAKYFKPFGSMIIIIMKVKYDHKLSNSLP